MAYTGITELIMPDSATEVQSYICYKCPNLKKVVIGDSLKELGQQAGWNCFYECTSLEELTLGSSLEIIGNGSFAYSKIKNLFIPDSVKQINYAAFGECSELSEVTGGSGLIRISRLAFYNDIALTSFPFETSDSYRYISVEVFEGCVFPLNVPDYLTVSDTGDYVRYDASLVFEGELLYSEAYDVLDLANEERSKQGLPAVSMDEELMDASFQRAAELAVPFSHTRPPGDTCFTVSDKAFAENVAMGQWDAASAMGSWMSSSGHRANILGGSWKSIGVGAFRQGGTVYWVQLFGGADPIVAAQPSDVVQNMTVNIMDENHAIQASVFYVDIESGGNVSNLGLNVGERGRVALWISRSGGFSHVSDSCVAWSSSDPEVASNDESGIVTAHKPGVATMTAKADRSTGFYTASYDIAVLGDVFADVDGTTSHYGDIVWLADRGSLPVSRMAPSVPTTTSPVAIWRRSCID